MRLRPDLVIRRSRIHGRGLFTRKPLPPRRKIGELSGQIISLRAARVKATGRNIISIVELDDARALDASVNPNAFRYVNHSCSPNTYIRIYRERVEFYTLRRIAAGEELTCDYGESHHEGKRKCACGAAGCREFI